MADATAINNYLGRFIAESMDAISDMEEGTSEAKSEDKAVPIAAGYILLLNDGTYYFKFKDLEMDPLEVQTAMKMLIDVLYLLSHHEGGDLVS